MGGNRDKKRQTTLKPICKYGKDCYQENPEHRKKYTHPSPSKEDTSNTAGSNGSKTSIRKRTFDAVSEEQPKVKTKDIPTSSSNISKADVNESSSSQKCKRKSSSSFAEAAADIKEKFLVEMPSDFYDMWEFCMDIHQENPAEAFSDLKLHLVGPYDILSKKISFQNFDSNKILCHYRYYYDPPEFMTVIAKDGKEGYHMGYFRDDPSEMPFGLASNCATEGPKLTLAGDNIFAAVNLELTTALKKCQDSLNAKFRKVQKALIDFAKERNYSLEKETERTKARRKKVVAKTFHELGIVVPYDKSRQLGYRSLPVTNAQLKNILSRIVGSKTEEERLNSRDSLDEVLTNLQFANDECDYGMGLELGIDLFCFGDPYLHKDVLIVLRLAYDLLHRPAYSRIIEAHLQHRRKGSKVSVDDICEPD